MKKYLMSLAVALMAVVGLVSCGDDDPIVPSGGKYEYYEPCTKWKSSMQEVREFMKSQSGWVEDSDLSSRGIIAYRNYKLDAQINYVFDAENVLSVTELTYYRNNSKFEQFKGDWTKKYNIEWVWDEDNKFFYAKLPAKGCNVTIGQRNNYVESMIISLSHSFLYDED